MELSEKQIHNMIQKAADAHANAYAPYSGFHVGAAVLGGSGNIYGGCNVENSSFGLTLCAERSAVANAISEGETQIEAVVVFTDTAEPTLPCAACRGVLAEFNRKLPVIMVTKSGIQKETNLTVLLPDPFVLHSGKRSEQNTN